MVNNLHAIPLYDRVIVRPAAAEQNDYFWQTLQTGNGLVAG